MKFNGINYIGHFSAWRTTLKLEVLKCAYEKPCFTEDELNMVRDLAWQNHIHVNYETDHADEILCKRLIDELTVKCIFERLTS